MLDDNEKYKIVRLALIHVFAREKWLDIHDLSISDFQPLMDFVKKCYINSVKYRDLCVSGKVSDIDVT